MINHPQTLQEIFDIVAVHLLTQKVRSTYEEFCAYHGPNGTKCAIGCLISDEEYVSEIEFKNVIEITLNLKFEWMLPYLHELSILQHIHDKTNNWKEKLLEFAYMYNLSTKMIDCY